MTVRLLVCCHEERRRGDDLLTTVMAGAALYQGENGCDFSDDDGENISSLNPIYNELTVLYWAWKNYDKLGSPDYIGLMHERRYFYFGEAPRDVRLRTDASAGAFRERSGLTEERLKESLRKGDFLCPRPSRRLSVRSQYALTHRARDLRAVEGIVKRDYPAYAEAAETYLKGKENYFFNMFVLPKELFFRYAAFVFPILDTYLAEGGGGGRLFLSERLTGMFITELKREGYHPNELPVLIREGAREERIMRFRTALKKRNGLKCKARALAALLIKRRKESRRI